MTLTRTFLGWRREGLSAALEGEPPAGTLRAPLPATVALRNSSRSQRVPIELAGPADVVGLDPHAIVRTEPHDGAADFEPSYFPYVEVRQSDLPWRFTPVGPHEEPLRDPEHPRAQAQPHQSLRPWLALAAVPVDAATVTPAAPGRLPLLSCPTDELPNAGEVWAWVHVQVATADGEDPADFVTDPAHAIARLICPRRLSPATRYLGCLVPTFAAGRLGTGPPADDPLAPAWGPASEATLPIYFSYSFTTGGEGSFETLARRLRPRPAPAGAYGREIATDAPGWGVPHVAGASTRMQGALRALAQPGAPGDEIAPDAQLAGAIGRAISASAGAVALRPPIYGQDFAGAPTAVDSSDAGWLTELNTDARRRIAAGTAAWAMAVEQEDLSDRAWQQLAEHGLRPATTADLQLAAELSAVLVDRHGSTPGAVASAALARLARPGGPLSPTGEGAASLSERIGAAWRGGALRASAPAARPQAFTPTFDEPAYTYLRAIAPEWLLPAGADIPEDSIVVLRTNPAFAEAFLVGLNHALARELAWRRYPLEPTATMFRRFWGASPNAPDTELEPMAEWQAHSGLGSHSPSADQLVLLVRGQLLRRFPTAVVYLSKAAPDGSEAHLRPTLTATLAPGTTLFGFPLTPDEVLRDDAGAAGWSIVIQESIDHARFGCDDPKQNGTTEPPDAWQDLDWSHPQLRDARHVPIAGPLAGVTRPLTKGPSPVSVPSATWGLNAGHLAAITQQPAFRIRIPVRLWMTAAA